MLQLKLIPVAMDQRGIVVDDLKAKSKRARVVAPMILDALGGGGVQAWLVMHAWQLLSHCRCAKCMS